MTSKVKLFMVRALSAWCWSLCSAIVRSSVSKSFICWESSSFQDSRSEIIWEKRRKIILVNPLYSACLLPMLHLRWRLGTRQLSIQFTHQVWYGLDMVISAQVFNSGKQSKRMYLITTTPLLQSMCAFSKSPTPWIPQHCLSIRSSTHHLFKLLSLLLKETVNLKHLFYSSDYTK